MPAKFDAVDFLHLGLAARQNQHLQARINAHDLRFRAASDRQVDRVTSGSAPGVEESPFLGQDDLVVNHLIEGLTPSGRDVQVVGLDGADVEAVAVAANLGGGQDRQRFVEEIAAVVGAVEVGQRGGQRGVEDGGGWIEPMHAVRVPAQRAS